MSDDYSEHDRREVARRAATFLQAAAEEIEEAALEVERSTGERILRRRPALADATRGDLQLLAVQAETGAAAIRAAIPWVPNGMTLGAVIKTLPPHLAFELTTRMRAAGLDV